MRKKFEQDHVSASKPAAKQGVGGHAALTPEVILAAIGTLDAGHMNRAGQLLEELPDSLRKAAHEPLAAEALIYAMLLMAGNEDTPEIPDWFSSEIGEAVFAEVKKLISKLKGGDRNWYLPLSDMAHASLRGMSKGQYETFYSVIRRIVVETENSNLFAFAIEKIVERKMNLVFSGNRTPEIRHHNLKTLEKELSVLLSALSYASDAESENAWNSGLEPIRKAAPADMKLLSPEECTLTHLDKVLDELAASANPVKKYILSAVIHTVMADKKITIEEKEMVRAISEALDCPLPIGALG